MGIEAVLKKANNSLTFITALFIGTYHILNIAGIISVSAIVVRILHVMAMLTIVYLNYPKPKDDQKFSLLNYVQKYVFVFLTLYTGIYILFRWRIIAERGNIANSTDVIVGVIMILIVLEAARRVLGRTLCVVASLFVLYPFLGQYLPGILHSRVYSITRVSTFLYLGTDGIYGIPTSVSANYIIMFAIFGAFLSAYGVGEFMFRLSSSLTAKLRGGTAKTAIVFSTLIGMVSGSAAGNVAVTGVFTIPMMIKKGFKREVAAAVEAIASTGGQIMPPIMGAAAFMMAEITGMPYVNIMKSAIVPALIYFISIYMVIHITAVKENIDCYDGVTPVERPIKALKDGWYYLIPIITLVGFMIYGYSPFKSAYHSIQVLLVIYLIAKRDFTLKFLKGIVNALQDAARDTAPIATACAAAGIISGIISLTGVGAKIGSMVIAASQGNILIALLLTMFVSIILGMGLPTTAAYIVVATIVAPALIKMGLPVMSAHMFVFFFACISTITPPVALASFVAAGIAKADTNKVGYTAVKLGLVSFVLPFMFVYGEGLLLLDTVWVNIFTVIMALFALYAIATGIVGYYKINLKPLERVLMLVGGILVMFQGIVTDVVGLAIVIATAIMINIKYKNMNKMDNCISG